MENSGEPAGDGSRVVIQRRRSDRPYRVVDGQQPLTGWCKGWEYTTEVASKAGWSGEVVDVTGDEAADPPLTTKHGYPLDEVVSALQKSVRRSDEVGAGYWARELVVSGMWRYCWRRLLIIATEDVGFGSPETVALVESLRSAYCWTAETSSRPPGWNQMLAMAVLALARAPKSREVDDYCWWLDSEVRDLPVPDVAVDQHTKRGKAMGREVEFFFAESGRLENEAYPSAYEQQARRLWLGEES